MAKDLPYFKFYSSEWNDGDITIESLETQGLFINICSLYWSKHGDLKEKFIRARFSENIDSLESLINENLISVTYDGLVSVRFLDEQMGNFDKRAVTSAQNGKKGGRPPKPKKPNENLMKPNIEERKEEDIREDDKKEDTNSSDVKRHSNNLDFDYNEGVFLKDIPEAWLRVWIDAYPAVDIIQEIKRAQAWLAANPTKRKKDHRGFLNRWIAKEQERGGVTKSNSVNHPFADFIAHWALTENAPTIHIKQLEVYLNDVPEQLTEEKLYKYYDNQKKNNTYKNITDTIKRTLGR